MRPILPCLVYPLLLPLSFLSFSFLPSSFFLKQPFYFEFARLLFDAYLAYLQCSFSFFITAILPTSQHLSLSVPAKQQGWMHEFFMFISLYKAAKYFVTNK